MLRVCWISRRLTRKLLTTTDLFYHSTSILRILITSLLGSLSMLHVSCVISDTCQVRFGIMQKDCLHPRDLKNAVKSWRMLTTKSHARLYQEAKLSVLKGWKIWAASLKNLYLKSGERHPKTMANTGASQKEWKQNFLLFSLFLK